MFRPDKSYLVCHHVLALATYTFVCGSPSVVLWCESDVPLFQRVGKHGENVRSELCIQYRL